MCYHGNKNVTDIQTDIRHLYKIRGGDEGARSKERHIRELDSEDQCNNTVNLEHDKSLMEQGTLSLTQLFEEGI